jgi:hypothetical protein
VLEEDKKMKCNRCEQDKEIRYRVFSEILNIKVCADCADEAHGLHLGIEIIEGGEMSELAGEYMRRAS